ncbi:MAG: pyridoxamine 5'-phosphate oxidase family protein [bacterium]|nr:pyridoxamine 5'-phosphate oxidase family protein [bacterium]
MRRSDKQITDPAELESLLSSSEICHLSMVDDGKPYVVPMNFGYADGALYFHSAPEGRKIDILGKNPDVCFSIIVRNILIKGEKACSWTAKYSSVTGTGKAEVINVRKEKEKGMSILMSQYSDKEFDFSEVDLTGVVVIRVVIEEITGKSSDAGKELEGARGNLGKRSRTCVEGACVERESWKYTQSSRTISHVKRSRVFEI